MSKVLFGVDHVGIGIKNVESMRSFYREVLGFDRVFGELPEKDHEPIHYLLRSSPTIHSGIQLSQTDEGVDVALFHTVIPVVRPIRRDFKYGDIGLNKITISVSDINRFVIDFKDRINFCTQLKNTRIPDWGDYKFVYSKDPEGNLIEFIADENIEPGKGFGCASSVGIGVTDLDRSFAFYQRYLGFDKVVIKRHECFSGMVDEISDGEKTQVRSCLLANSEGSGMVELIETLKPRGRSIPFGTIWGDYGYLQIALYGDNLNAISDYFEENDIEILMPPQRIDDTTRAGGFMYVRDPDGIPVECVAFPKE